MFIVNVEGAVYKGDKWLLITRSVKEEHAGGTLSFVGGKVDPEKENTLDILEKTVRREVYEEVGVELKDTITYIYSSLFGLDDGRQVINVVLLCEYDKGTAYNKSPDEVDAVHWLTTDEVLEHLSAPPWLKESIVRADELRKL
ncbi:NUDIX hydrolase [Bacillus horti]|uniref:8-oxo-dGTP pyrophosphatase MutT (NUDIX family) n=1 Tax=Caldalkalibacillus horti TaxID=77523 RepID=A0ABT9W161_9BACI|nr:NUDIX domain-containing protein [Bacillus horti]MDQ0167002.1 8-oxo-dGTP pyrophosphatase MutT (NUDIX family) [Bacillus horti]